VETETNTKAARRPVRVTIDGEAYSPAEGVLIVVRQDGGKVCLPEGPGVTVEDVVPPRVWMDGDVVFIDPAHGSPYVAHRAGGAWPTTAGGKLEDAHIDHVLSHTGFSVQVLRYQSGGAV